ncbi:hypothetical protein [Methanobrevibacter sp.]|uniref:hypothetical protein n=1 Tax=Methanobrevibacter sp. TaxID=66852 RepID=UPI00386B3397
MQEVSDELIVSFLFPPSDYVSGITVSKRIIENGEIVDVLQARCPDNVDSQFNQCVDKYINERILIDMDCDVDWSDCIFKFSKLGIKAIKRNYKRIYSRSWLMANHFLALEYKFKNESCFWKAEFSDPLIYDLSNRPKRYKQMQIDDEEYIRKINNRINIFNQNNSTDFPLVENNVSAYFICEYMVYLFADKITFTNENQREIMLSQFPIDIYEYAFGKSEVKVHPTLDESYYHIADSRLQLDGESVNVAYFGGDYYGKRHFEALFYAFESLNHKFKDKIKLYLFINDKKLIKRLILPLSFKDNIIVKKPLEYLEFLNATTEFDVLVVNDVITEGSYKINPYFPSKFSDYLGSDTDIWAISQKGSALSNVDVRYKSDICDFKSCGEELVKILNDRGFVDEEYSFEEYYIKRLTFLNELYEKEFRKNIKLKKDLKELKKSNKKFKLF